MKFFSYVFERYVNDDCGVSDPHKTEGHVQESHDHRATASSEQGEDDHHKERKAERTGIQFSM